MPHTLWTAESAQQATGGTLVGGKDWKATSVSIDSRKIEPGALFIALKGEQFDGHDFVKKAFENGAAVAMVSHIPANLPENACILQVSDTEKALVALGSYKRLRSRAVFIGVTGSVGKTSTKGMMQLACEAIGKTYANEGNLNNHLGTPLSLARLPDDAEYAVMEMGMNHAGEIKYLTHIVKPHIAIITSIAPVHIEFFPSLSDIALAKAEIFDDMGTQGTAILNADTPHHDVLVEQATKQSVSVINFGESPKAECRLLNYAEENGQAVVTAEYKNKQYSYRLGLIGKHQALNSLAVLSAIITAEGDAPKAMSALTGYTAQEGRGRCVTVHGKQGTFHVVDDCYNASPASVVASLRAVRRHPGGRLIAALGEMRELGERSAELHKGLAPEIIEQKVDVVFTVGTQMQALYDVLPQDKRGGHFSTTQESLQAICAAMRDGDTILVKGSNGVKMKVLVAALLQQEQQQGVG